MVGSSMARVANEALALLWSRRIAAQRRSPLSVAAYCGQEEVSPKSFYAWRRRLGASQERARPALFVPVELPSSATPAGSLRIELPGGAVVVAPPDASQDLITTVIRALLQAAREQPAC